MHQGLFKPLNKMGVGERVSRTGSIQTMRYYAATERKGSLTLATTGTGLETRRSARRARHQGPNTAGFHRHEAPEPSNARGQKAEQGRTRLKRLGSSSSRRSRRRGGKTAVLQAAEKASGERLTPRLLEADDVDSTHGSHLHDGLHAPVEGCDLASQTASVRAQRVLLLLLSRVSRVRPWVTP